MASRIMREVEVTADEDGIQLQQWDPSDETNGVVRLTYEQVPLLFKLIDDAAREAGYSVEPPSGNRKDEEVRAQLRLFERLGPAAAGGPLDQASPLDAVEAALRWACGDSDVAPDEWLFDDTRRE